MENSESDIMRYSFKKLILATLKNGLERSMSKDKKPREKTSVQARYYGGLDWRHGSEDRVK